METVQNKIKLYYNKNKKNNNNDSSAHNYNINLCQLIDEEKILLINKKNEIIIYNFETEMKENSFSFLNSDYLIIDIIINDNILYILYKEGLFIIYNIDSKKIEKYIISNIIDKGNLLYLRNQFIIIIIKEEKSNIIKLFLLKNYFYIQLNEININPSNNMLSHPILLPDDNFYYFYTENDNLNVLYMNIFNQIDIINKAFENNNINHNEYLKIVDDLNKNIKFINKKTYQFNEIFFRNDINKNSFKMTNIVINELNNNI